jgi:arabinofuranosyltransferase
MNCPRCGTANSAGRRFCADCGSPLSIVCPSCGYSNEPGVKFCGGCGATTAAIQAMRHGIMARFGGSLAYMSSGLGWLFISAVVITLAVMYVMAARAETFNIQGMRVATLTDDAYISMRYARHLADGHGLVWNIGEAPVEGFTNFLWVVWIAFLMKLFGEPSYAMIATAATFHAISVILFYRLLTERYKAHWLPACSATLLLAAWEPIRTQVFVALEAPLLLCLFVASLYLVSSPSRTSRLAGALAAGLLPLIRPDGLFLTALVTAQYVTIEGREGIAGNLRRHATALGCFVGPLLLLTVGRIVYFGDALPNTYYLKVVDRPGRLSYGLDYVTAFVKAFYGSLLFVPLLVFAIVERTVISLIAAVGIVGILTYIAYQGGDLADWWRFMIPLLPLFLILFALLASKLLRQSTWRAMPLLGVVLCVALVGIGVRREYELVTSGYFFLRPSPEMADNTRMGLALRAVCSREALAADFWAGATPYFSELRTIDMLGRSDKVIARRPASVVRGVPGHDKFDFDYVLGRRPDVIISAFRVGASASDVQGAKLSRFPFGALLLERLDKEPVYAPVESVLSEAWHGIYARRGDRACDWERLPAVERELGLTCSATFSNGWYGLERDGAYWWRWNTGRGTIRMFSNISGGMRLRGLLLAPSQPNRADIYMNSIRVWSSNEIAGAAPVPIDVPLRIAAGLNTVEIAGRNPPKRVGADHRTLGIGVGQLELVPENGMSSCVGLP